MKNSGTMKRRRTPAGKKTRPSVLKVARVKGAPGWLLDGKPYVPIMAQAGKADEPDAGNRAGRKLPKSSFFRAGCSMYTTWEHGPQLREVWKEDGRYDWSEIDGYLRKLAALDPRGRLHGRFRFDAPDWWIQRHPEQMVHVRQLDGTTQQTKVVSFASRLYWDEA